MWTNVKGMKKYLLLMAAGILFSLGTISAIGESTEALSRELKVNVIMSGDGELYAKSLLALKQTSSDTLFNDYTIDEWLSLKPQSVTDQGRLIVAIGARATEKLLATKTDIPILSLMIPSVTFRQMVQDNQRLQQKINSGKLSAIFMDQPASRQVNLARIIVPDLEAIGTLYESPSELLVEQLNDAAQENQIILRAKKLSRNDNPIVVLRKMYSDIDVFVAIPGKYIFNKSVAKWMLYLSYKNKKPLLGFSSDYVSAGALAAVYSNPESIARQAGEWIKNFQKNYNLEIQPAYPKYFSVTINREVADQLNIEISSDAELERDLSELESGQ